MCLHLLAGLLGIGGLFLLFHQSKYPHVWWYSRLYFEALGIYFAILLAVIAAARWGAEPLAVLLRFRAAGAGLLLVTGCALSLVVLEGVLAPLPDRVWDLNPAAREGPIFARAEPPLHHIRPANTRQLIVSPYGEYRVDVRINSDGLRDVERPIAKPAGTRRVLVLGDSMVEGEQVLLEETFPKAAERVLIEATGRPIDVINAGVASYSPTPEYLLLKYKGLRYTPDVVVMAFFPADVADDWAYRKDLVFDERGVPVRRAPRDENLRRDLGWALLAHSRALRFLIGNAILLMRNPLTDLSVSIFEPEYTAREREAWEISKTAIRATRELAEGNGARFVLVVIPYAIQVGPREGAAGARRLKAPELLKTSTRPQQVLAEFAREQGMLFLDLLPALRSAGVHPLFFDYDSHFTPLGHRVAARAIGTFILDHGLVSR